MKLREKVNTFEIRHADESDLNHILQLLKQAAVWIQTKNSEQWGYYITDLEGNTPEVLDSIKNNSTYVLLKDDEIIGTITLEDQAYEWDHLIWGDQVNEDGVVYLHRIVVSRDFAGRDIGEELISWAKRYVKDNGYKRIRFDCLASNQGLNDYYQRKYESKGKVTVYGGEHMRYEILV